MSWADISAKLSLVCPAKRNANSWIVILCTEFVANKFDLIWFEYSSSDVTIIWFHDEKTFEVTILKNPQSDRMLGRRATKKKDVAHGRRWVIGWWYWATENAGVEIAGVDRTGGKCRSKSYGTLNRDYFERILSYLNLAVVENAVRLVTAFVFAYWLIVTTSVFVIFWQFPI